MYLKRLTVKNFRCIKHMDLEFQKGVNIIIGENNTGKTAIIDALRICLSYGSQRRDIYVSLSDFYVDQNAPENTAPEKQNQIAFDLIFEVEDQKEDGIFNELISESGDKELALHFLYYRHETKGIERIRWKVWGGDKEGQQIPPELLELLYFVYLDALRDATTHLRPVRGSRLGELFYRLETDEDRREGLAGKLRKAVSDDAEWNALIKKGQNRINEHLQETLVEGKGQKIEIDFLPFEFRRIVDSLRIQLPLYPSEENPPEQPNTDDSVPPTIQARQRYLDLGQNGLGYNNLIYAATVLGELKRRKQAETRTFVALLIEEPEAHLHPQHQNTFFAYLDRLNEIGFQVFVTSHSPTITARAQLDSLIVLHRQADNIGSFLFRQSDLSPDNKKFLRKFLDVTKSQLLFANGVLLVEGISEALLLPIFSVMIGATFDIVKNGVEVVNLNGVAFEHFARLYNSADSNKRLSCRCAIISDDDRKDGKISDRAKATSDLQMNLLRVRLAERTFEYELFKAGNNKNLLLDILSVMHPVVTTEIRGASESEQAKLFVKKIESNKAKSELAHRLAIKLQEDSAARANFSVPLYIQQAVKWVVAAEEPSAQKSRGENV